MHDNIKPISDRMQAIEKELSEIDRVYKGLPLHWMNLANARIAELKEELESLNTDIETLLYYSERLMHLARNIPYSDYLAKTEADLADLGKILKG